MGTASREGMAWGVDEPQRDFKLTCDVYFLCLNGSGSGKEWKQGRRSELGECSALLDFRPPNPNVSHICS